LKLLQFDLLGFSYWELIKLSVSRLSKKRFAKCGANVKVFGGYFLFHYLVAPLNQVIAGGSFGKATLIRFTGILDQVVVIPTGYVRGTPIERFGFGIKNTLSPAIENRNINEAVATAAFRQVIENKTVVCRLRLA
jgi:hypothetical protein